MNDEIRKLGQKIEWLKAGGFVDAKERADSCLYQAKIVLNDFERRIARLEKLYENVEVMK